MQTIKELLTELKNKLPRGSAQKITHRLKMQGNPLTRQYISRCLDPDHTDYSPVVILAAVTLAEEYTAEMNELCQRIGRLNDTIL
jgi:hypothetical protein